MMNNDAYKMTDDTSVPDQTNGILEEPASRGPGGWLVPTIVVAVIIGLVAVALLRGQTNYDPTTPEGAVQEYLQAIVDQRWEDALEVLDPEVFAECRPEHLSSNIWQEDFTAVHTATREGQFTTYVVVRFDHQDGGLIGGWSWSTEFALVERGGLWYITEDPWPHFRYLCSFGRG